MNSNFPLPIIGDLRVIMLLYVGRNDAKNQVLRESLLCPLCGSVVREIERLDFVWIREIGVFMIRAIFSCV